MHGSIESIHGSIRGSMHGSMDESMHGSMDGSTDGSMHGSMHGSIHGSIQKVVKIRKNLSTISKNRQNLQRVVKICKKSPKSGWLASWVNVRPPSSPSLLGKKIQRRLLLVSVGLDGWTCIERRLDHYCLDVFVGWLLIPTRRESAEF